MAHIFIMDFWWIVFFKADKYLSLSVIGSFILPLNGALLGAKERHGTSCMCCDEKD